MVKVPAMSKINSMSCRGGSLTSKEGNKAQMMLLTMYILKYE